MWQDKLITMHRTRVVAMAMLVPVVVVAVVAALLGALPSGTVSAPGPGLAAGPPGDVVLAEGGNRGW